MAFDLYFAGSPVEETTETIRKLSACQLLSQLNDRKKLESWGPYMREHPECKCKVFADSGAFSAWTLGKKIDVENYIDFINRNSDWLFKAASVDCIPGKPKSTEVPTKEEVDEAAHQTWENFLYMRSKLNDKSKLLWTYHFGEDPKWLKQALEFEDEFGKIDYIAFGGLVGKGKDAVEIFLRSCFQIINASNHKDIKTHAFGVTIPSLLQAFPLTSSDSTAWIMYAVNGGLYLDGKITRITELSMGDSSHFINKSKAIQDLLMEHINKWGFKWDELVNDYKQRECFNIHAFKEMYDKYEYKGSMGYKPDLF